MTEPAPSRRVPLFDLVPIAGRASTALAAFVRLRWVALVLLAGAALAVRAAWQVDLPLGPMLGALAFAGITNLALARLGPEDRGRGLVGGALIVDVVVLTVFLALSGGPANPLSILYLLHVTLAAILAPRVWTWVVVAVTSLGFGLLFFVSVPLPPELGGHGHGMEHGGGSYSAHLQGMWLAHTLAAATIAAFVSRVTDALRAERERRERTARLLGLASLAAGAAHELGNPLGTIRLAASELQRGLTDAAPALADDAELIDAEVTRAKAVVDRLAASAGELTGEAVVPTDVAALLDDAAQRVSGGEVRVRVDAPLPAARWPKEAVTQVVLQLLRNAVQASDREVVRCEAAVEGAGIRIDIVDTGAGMSPEILARVSEPFFTTREGEGMGLGVFIAQSLVEHLGGHLAFTSRPGRGTHALVWLPTGVA